MMNSIDVLELNKQFIEEYWMDFVAFIADQNLTDLEDDLHFEVSEEFCKELLNHLASAIDMYKKRNKTKNGLKIVSFKRQQNLNEKIEFQGTSE